MGTRQENLIILMSFNDFVPWIYTWLYKPWNKQNLYIEPVQKQNSNGSNPKKRWSIHSQYEKKNCAGSHNPIQLKSDK